MSLLNNIGKFFVRLGRSLMLPIAVLPVAGILLRIGQPDIYGLFLSDTSSESTIASVKLVFSFFGDAGGAVFSNLPIIFAIGVAIGFADENHGAAALAAFVGHAIFIAALKVVLPEANMGVLSGILIGAVAGFLYNKYKGVNFPSYIAFFGGRRFVPIITGVAALVLAAIAAFVWPPIEHAISAFGNWIISSGNIGLFSYGVANRLLIPLGLHHILNTLVWFTVGDYSVIENGVSVVKHGDLWRFFAGDPTAGSFMAGFFPPLMFGLPGAALAIVLSAKPENRKIIAGVFISTALTAFLTGITEPIEFSFLFLAFPLYLLHALLTGLSFIIMNFLHVKLGFTFSAGLFDYLVSFSLGKNGILLLPVGLAYFILYFLIFYFAIRIWNLKTPGREDESLEEDKSEALVEEIGVRYLEALGGAENVVKYDSCTTRLRLEVKDNTKIDEEALKKLGAKGVINSVKGSVQIVVGPEVEIVLDKIKRASK